MRLAACTCLIALLAAGGCERSRTPAPAARAAHDTATPSALPTLADAAAAPQPALRTLDFAPVVQDFAPGQVVLHAPTLDVQVNRVAYGPYGMSIDAEVHQTAGDLQTFLNGGDTGVLRDDAGTVYRLREDGRMLGLHMGRRGDVWKATLQAYGFVPEAAKRMTLSLNVAPFGGGDTLVEAGWPLPADLARTRRLLPDDAVDPGRGWRFAEPRTGMDADGRLGARVYGVAWLRDGIAVDMELVNGLRDSAQSLYRAQLVDDRGHASRFVQHTGGRGSVIGMGKGERQAGRFLFQPQPAPGARRLTLQLGEGSPMVAVDLGAIPPAAMPGLPAPAAAPAMRYLDYREEPRRVALPSSRLDRVAELKRDLEAVDEAAGTRVDLPGDVLFDFDRATLRPDARVTLDRLAELIVRLDRPAGITGYTDSKGEDAYNLRLSLDRARAVHAALRARDVPVRLLREPTGRGEADPRAPNAGPDGRDDPAGRARNRRVEVLIAQPAGG